MLFQSCFENIRLCNDIDLFNLLKDSSISSLSLGGETSSVV